MRPDGRTHIDQNARGGHRTWLPVPSHERAVTCAGCGQDILVCGYVDDIDPDVYRGVVCGCRRPVEPRAVDLRGAIDRARAVATGKGIPY